MDDRIILRDEDLSPLLETLGLDHDNERVGDELRRDFADASGTLTAEQVAEILGEE